MVKAIVLFSSCDIIELSSKRSEVKVNFSDIPQIIQDGNWQCDFTLVDLVERIEQYKNKEEEIDIKLEMNPDFQRNHVWTEEQEIAYIEALVQGGAKHARVIYLNCPDWNFNNKGDYHDFVCVDGLQRYTAIEKFVHNKIKVFGHYLDEFEDKDRFCRKFIMKLNINDLRSKEDVLKWYLQINDGGTPHTKEEIDKVKKMLESK
jgi:hypothetical protein